MVTRNWIMSELSSYCSALKMEVVRASEMMIHVLYGVTPPETAVTTVTAVRT
jgi:hypothetical protein